ncbi:MAG: ABC transporter ATP-binding protein [Planctomycetota bacterium]
MPQPNAIVVEALSHRYGERTAVDGLSLTVEEGEVFVFLGPNGSGKTTLFRVLSTLIPIQSGRVEMLGHDLATQTNAVRNDLGVVFQAPSLDKKLTVSENLRHQGRLYGLAGQLLRQRTEEMLSAVGLSERAGDIVETLSGGMRRRVELAKGLLHNPSLLLLDEPSTGLDPGSRADLWRYLHTIRERDGVTIVLTTHLLEEAERADRIAIMDKGRLAALDTPTALRASVGGDSILLQSGDPAALAAAVNERWSCNAAVIGGAVRLEQPDGHEWVSRLATAFPNEIDSITLGKPTLEDVFIDRTGHRFFGDQS